MKILCFSAHPDDFEHSVGGTLKKLTKKGHNVLIYVSRECEGIRLKEQRNSCKILGCKLLTGNLTFEPASEMAEIEELTNLIRNYKPDRVYIPAMDINQHHRRLNEMCFSALRRTKIDVYIYAPTTARAIELYDFKPNLYEDISKEFKYKIKALKCHKSQLKRLYDNDISFLEHRSSFYGFDISVEHAERFQIMREVR